MCAGINFDGKLLAIDRVFRRDANEALSQCVFLVAVTFELPPDCGRAARLAGPGRQVTPDLWETRGSHFDMGRLVL